MSFIHPSTFRALVCGTGLLFATAVLGASETTPARFAGTYASGSAGSAKPAPSMDVSLGLDGTATVTEDPVNRTITHFGHWVETGNDVSISFDAVAGAPAEPPMIFQPDHDGLRAITWNHATWGKTTPPVVKNRSRVKQRLADRRSQE